MLLFLMGVDLTTIVLLLVLLLVFGRIIFWLTRQLLRRAFKHSSDEKVKLFSWISAVVLSPVIVIGSFALLIYISVRSAPQESKEDVERSHYEMMEEDLNKDLKVGMSKAKVVALFGEADTTQSVFVYDLSPPNAIERYILEISFDSTGLKDFKRR